MVIGNQQRGFQSSGQTPTCLTAHLNEKQSKNQVFLIKNTRQNKKM
jgi:hypothetical protein